MFLRDVKALGGTVVVQAV